MRVEVRQFSYPPLCIGITITNSVPTITLHIITSNYFLRLWIWILTSVPANSPCKNLSVVNKYPNHAQKAACKQTAFFLLVCGGRSRGGKPAESAEAHRSSVLTAKRTPETGAPGACTGAEFPEANGETMKRLVLRAFEDSRRGPCRRVRIKKAVLSHRPLR